LQKGILYSTKLLGIVDGKEKGNECYQQDYRANEILGKSNFKFGLCNEFT